MEEIEVWKDIPDYPNYQISNYGRVKSLNYRNTKQEQIIKLSKNSKGYLYVDLFKDGKRKRFLVHRLVCLTYLKNPENLPCMNHKDENPLNNRVENLEMCSYEYNMNYGTILERKSKALKGRKLSEEHKRKISEAHSIPIIQYTKDGIFVRYWDSAKSASKELNINLGHIISSYQNKRKTCGGFIWKYKKSI